MARPGRPERNRAARSFRQLSRFHHVINTDKVFGTHSRSALEFAAYALHISRNPTLGPVWLNRHDDPESLEAAKNAFSHRKVAATVVAVDKHAGERFDELYQRTI